MDCPICDGKGKLLEYGEPEIGYLYYPCALCEKSGNLSPWKYFSKYWFWTTWLGEKVIDIWYLWIEYWMVPCPTCSGPSPDNIIDFDCPTCDGNGGMTRWERYNA